MARRGNGMCAPSRTRGLNQKEPHRVHRGAAISCPHSPHDGNTSCSTQNCSSALQSHQLCAYYACIVCLTGTQHRRLPTLLSHAMLKSGMPLATWAMYTTWMHVTVVRAGCSLRCSVCAMWATWQCGLVLSAMYTVLHDSRATAHALIWQASRTCAQLMRGHGRPSIRHCGIDHCKTGIGS